MITIKEHFFGYPGGKKREFKKDERPTDLPAEFEAMLIRKGLAAGSPPAAKIDAPEKSASNKEARK